MKNQISAGVTMESVTCTYNKTHITKIQGRLHTWPLNLRTGNIQNDVHFSPIKSIRSLIGLISCPYMVPKTVMQHHITGWLHIVLPLES